MAPQTFEKMNMKLGEFQLHEENIIESKLELNKDIFSWKLPKFWKKASFYSHKYITKIILIFNFI